MNDNPGGAPEDFEAMLRKFLSGQGNLDPEQLAAAAGLANNPEAMAELARQMQLLFAGMTGAAGATDSTGVNWQLAEQQARSIAKNAAVGVSHKFTDELAAALKLGKLWLSKATSISELTNEPKFLTRELWVADSLPLFRLLAEPVANRMSLALSESLNISAPEELSKMLAGASGLLKSAGATLFAMQLGQAIGKLSSEVLAGGDIGLPIFQEQRAAFVMQNLDEFVSELGVDRDQALIYLAVRELAHASLFRHARWLREHVVSQITKYASEISINTDAVGNLATDFDPSNPDAIREALESGAFIAPRSEDQQSALETIETMLALIEGWVDTVTADACAMLPHLDMLREAVRRKRAVGGPAEKTFGTLIGLELRPKRLREAAAMWLALTTEVGAELRDSIWSHPDLMPSGKDIDNPAALAARITNGGSDLDRELRDLLGD